MPNFEFTITHNTTMSAKVKVSANTIEEAHEIAIRPDYYQKAENAVQWSLDEGNEIEAYIPDENDYEIVPGTESEFSDDYEGDLNIVPSMR